MPSSPRRRGATSRQDFIDLWLSSMWIRRKIGLPERLRRGIFQGSFAFLPIPRHNRVSTTTSVPLPLPYLSLLFHFFEYPLACLECLPSVRGRYCDDYRRLANWYIA